MCYTLHITGACVPGSRCVNWIVCDVWFVDMADLDLFYDVARLKISPVQSPFITIISTYVNKNKIWNEIYRRQTFKNVESNSPNSDAHHRLRVVEELDCFCIQCKIICVLWMYTSNQISTVWNKNNKHLIKSSDKTMKHRIYKHLSSRIWSLITMKS